MAFKKLEDYNESRFEGLFVLRDDGDYRDVIILYRSISDVLIADTHYIKSPDYSGYCHCLGRGCPACAKKIRVQTKLFVPLYDIQTGEILFFDRNSRFEQQLTRDVINKCANPSEYVFRITRKGIAGDVNTVYSFVPIYRNTVKSYDEIMAEHNCTSPEFYSRICKEFSASELQSKLDTTPSDNVSPDELPNYQAIPRGTVATPSSYTPMDIPDYNIPEFPKSEGIDSDDVVDYENDPLDEADVNF